MVRTPGHSRAWRVHRLGAPAVALQLDDVPVARPTRGQARVQVTAIGLNHPDLLLCSGRYQERPDLPFCPGYEAAGVVVDAGPGSIWQDGDHVIVVPELPNGAMQESLTVPDNQLYGVPARLPATTAATLHIAYATAHAALHRRASIRPGETLLVDGAAGGVGSAAVQLGVAAGARVLAVATGEAKARACEQAGAEAIDLSLTDDLVTTVRDLTDGHGADIVLDVVGGDLFDRARRCIAFEGRVVTVGFTSGTVPQAPVNHVLLRNYSLVGLHLAAYRRANPTVLREIHAELVRLAEDGRIAPTIHASLPFDEAPAGLDLLARREVVGRVVLRC
ncbi:NADPH:quinone oxidoreductase family protein [Leekyejoonella antrihumi]|uniref:NADPH:quinone oxidoreductase family protein n=1 Tax=Leekyejoonella antrihumi TaxID=1660198 RepID=A0A563E1C2_9MICO|nr:NADPH:quinone oxidoreductase family protein [Leekyejoonella antrihumi]TWP36328.1 NADPH:quinone oxidoreductase family protein [Leekyejoonella antrihumi]